MPINYQVVPNALTSPPSYTGRVVPKNVLNLDRICREINVHNPTITEDMARVVILAFKEEVKFQLLEGNTVNVESFCSWVSSLPIKLENATDTLPSNAVDVKAKPSSPFKTEFVNAATFSRLPYTDKKPNPSEAVDTNTGLRGWIRDGYPLRINGSNLGFDQTNADLGVWLVLADGTEIKQTNIGLNNPSSLVIIPNFEGSIPQGDQVEVTVKLKNKYTDNGQIRETNYTYRVRGTSDNNLFTVGTGDIPVHVSSYAGADKNVRFVAEILPSGVMTLRVGEIGGTMGSAIEVYDTTTTVDLPGLADALEVTIDDYALLVTNVTLYQKYMQQIAAITAPA